MWFYIIKGISSSLLSAKIRDKRIVLRSLGQGVSLLALPADVSNPLGSQVYVAGVGVEFYKYFHLKRILGFVLGTLNDKDANES